MSATIVISYRIDPKDPEEAQALEILRKYQAEGNNKTDVHVQAILRASGMKIYPRGSHRQVLMRLSELEARLGDELHSQRDYIEKTITNALMNLDLSQYVHRDSGRTVEEDLGDVVPVSVYARIFENTMTREFEVD